jgi:putative transposase
MSVKEKKAMITPNHSKLSIQKQCELIHLPRSSYYGKTDPAIETEENLQLMALIDQEYTRHPFLGSRKLRDYLRRQGHQVNRKRIQRLMQTMGIMSVAPKPNTSLGNKAHPVYPYLLRDLTIDHANQVWCTDISYIKLRGGFVYLVAVMDWYSRKVLSWELSNTMESSFCVSALERAIRLYGTPDIFNTDQGAQFTSEAFTRVLKQHQIKISMDGKGRWMDNVFIERLWRSVKYEDIYLKEYKSAEELRSGLKKYFQYYNHERTHQSHGILTPAEVYRAVKPLLETAA